MKSDRRAPGFLLPWFSGSLLLGLGLVAALAPVATCPYLDHSVHYGKWGCEICNDHAKVTPLKKLELIWSDPRLRR